MKNFKTFIYLFAAVAVLGFSGSAMATAIGSLNIANCPGGGVTVSANVIHWDPAGTQNGTGCIATGTGTNVTYSGGTLLPGVFGNIQDLIAGGGAVDSFMTFQGTTLDFILLAFGPGSANTNCANPNVGDSCSVVAGSPFILTNAGGGNTSVSLSANGVIIDGLVSSWLGSFTTQLNETSQQIANTILGGGSISSTHSAQFTLLAPTQFGTVPEPGTVSLFLLGGVALIGFGRKRFGK